MFIGDSSLKLETAIQLFAFAGLIHDPMGCSFVDLFEEHVDLGSQVGRDDEQEIPGLHEATEGA